ncbi:TPA: Phosphatase impl1, chloroplastic [Trebouxia sp. C0006]
MSLLSQHLRRSYASVGLRVLCKPSYTRRPLDKFRQLRHLAICDLNSTGPSLQRREPPAQNSPRQYQQSAMAGRSTAPPTEDFAALQQLALQAAKTGAEVVQEALDKPRNIHFKGVTDLVTDTDRASEEAILKVLQKEVPDHGFLGEEGGVSGNADSEYLWCIDPIDGTTNFAAGYPSFGVSVAVLHKAVPVAAAVVEFAGGPTAWVTRTYSASQGAGAQCNGKELKVTNTTDVTQSLLVTGFGYEHDEAWSANMELFKELTDVSRGVRRLGAAAVDLCHVALGITDGFWEYRLKPWDCAAGVLMVQEAGGIVTTMDGNPYTVFHRTTLAATPGLHARLLESTKPKTEALVNSGYPLGTWYVPDVYEQYVQTALS